MEEGSVNALNSFNCDHKKPHVYTQRQFDILNGFELIFTRCFSCHKVVGLEAKKISNR
jgi:hypothetical protein